MDTSTVTPRQITVVKASWHMLTPIANEAAAMFYQRLFELDPTLKLLFVRDMEQQGRKLMGMIGIAVNSLDRIDEIVPAIQELGRRHIKYGVKYQDYATVATALLWTLQQSLKQEFTPEVEAAWTAVYRLLADTMKEAALAEYNYHYRYGYG